MKQIFNYNKFNEEVADTLVESGYSLFQAQLDGKGATAEYEETNKTFNDQFMKYCVEAIPNTAYTSVEMIKNPMIHRNVFFLQAFDTVLAQIITPAVPTLVSAGYEQLYDVKQVGFGDNAKYRVESNELFIVSSLAEGIARGSVATTSDTEYTITARREQISTYIDWYWVASGKQNWGYLVSKIALSFSAYIQAKVCKAMASLITNAGTHGIAGYIANGMTDANFLQVSRLVKLANAGADVYCLGTSIALADVLPAASATSGFRYGEDSAIVKTGFLPSYKRIPLIELGQALVPNTINGTPAVVVPDNVLYFLPLGMNKPIHCVMEGDSVTVEKDPITQSTDHTYNFTVDMRIGVDVVVGSKIGAITLAG